MTVSKQILFFFKHHTVNTAILNFCTEKQAVSTTPAPRKENESPVGGIFFYYIYLSLVNV